MQPEERAIEFALGLLVGCLVGIWIKPTLDKIDLNNPFGKWALRITGILVMTSGGLLFVAVAESLQDDVMNRPESMEAVLFWIATRVLFFSCGTYFSLRALVAMLRKIGCLEGRRIE